ncbi:hypothetical protein ACPOL_2672 [Acidisarcina polymorpha]|uniref:Uncharacterized protein n=1 Tax=Acidisarcina polymorpha TaxID=2211140 RepID=A0A2Z5G014_9BACT|nr:hypothetical protein ACPOL_2672 [Acidisarcina polymorpha]
MENGKVCTGQEFNRTKDLAIAVGAGVYVWDDPEMVYTYSREDDGYTCLSDIHLKINSVTAPREADPPDHTFSAYGIISFVPYECLFQHPFYEESDINRASIGRYLVTNIAHFLAARAFWSTLARDHSVNNCLMETNWGGGDYIGPYLTAGLCSECIEIVESRPLEERLSYRLKARAPNDIYIALRQICAVPAQWDISLRIVNILGSKVIPFLFIGIGVGLFTNLLAGYGRSDFRTSLGHDLGQYAWQHMLAVTTALAAIAAIPVCRLALSLMRRTLP